MIEQKINFKEFPTTRYQGSKRKILPWIHEAVKDLRFETALDACGGSASVSYLFKKMGKHVTYNDKLKFNSLIGKALIENQRVRFLEEDLHNLVTNKELKSPNFISKNFPDMYYLENENKWLDRISYGILNMNHYRGQTLEYKKAIAYYALFQASMIKRPFNLFHRNNLDIRTNDVERNFGNKITWEKPFYSYLRKFVKEANSLVFDSKTDCKATNQSILEMNGDDYDLVYIDPPYLNQDGTNESSNYLKCYHFLEGIVNYDSWHELIDFDTINNRFKDTDTQNDFKQKNVYENFENIIYNFRKSKIVLSYKKGGIPSTDYLVKLMKKHKRKVYTKSLHYVYALNKQNGNAKTNREVLIIGV
jgi:adenine-specific DNA-methyltransferase